MNDIESQQKHFDAISDLYYRARQDKKHILVKKAIWDSIDIDIKDNSIVLEAMCGYCDALEILKIKTDKAFVYEAFDYSQPMISIAKKKYPQAHIWHGDITRFNSDKKYDFILVIGGLHHVYRHANRAIANLVNALKEDGRLIIFEPIHNNIVLRKIREFIYKHNKLFDEKTERGWTTKELNDLFSQKGMIPEQEVFPGLAAYVLWYNPDAFPILNIVGGGGGIVKALLNIEKRLWKSKLAKFLSFATLTVYKRNK